MRQNPLLRQAFTLVELLVATGIIAMLLALVAISYPSFNEREQLTRAVDKLRSGLLTARLWARRDNAITGVQYASDGSSFIYVQQPFAEFSGVATSLGTTVISGNTYQTCNIDISRVGNKIDFTGNSTNYIQKLKPYLDYIVFDGDVPHKLIAVQGTFPSGSLTLQSDIKINLLGQAPNFYHPFKIIRGVEPIPLQEDSLLGDRIVVNSSVSLPNNTICFSPTGQVINAPATSITLTLTQGSLTVGRPDETADVWLDCLSGTTRYRNP